MSFVDWLQESSRRLREDGLRRGVEDSSYELYVGALRRLGDVIGGGRSVFSEGWDVLLILDACRYDLMTEVAGGYDFIDDVGRFPSLGSSSQEWLDENFDVDAPLSETAYVTGNPFSERYLDAANFQVLDEVWRYAWDDELGTVRARPVTDRAISTWREHQPERMVVHYMQPHYPFVNDPDLHEGMVVGRFGESDEPFWQRVRHGIVSKERAWEVYRDNLRYVLDDVGLLLETIDADRVVISADHGNAVGEYGVYGHPGRVPLSVLRSVPWVESSASVEREYDVTTERADDIDADTEERLENLGYM